MPKLMIVGKKKCESKKKPGEVFIVFNLLHPYFDEEMNGYYAETKFAPCSKKFDIPIDYMSMYNIEFDSGGRMVEIIKVPEAPFED